MILVHKVVIKKIIVLETTFQICARMFKEMELIRSQVEIDLHKDVELQVSFDMPYMF